MQEDAPDFIEPEPMSALPESTTPAAVPDTLEQRRVCPFCGAVNATGEGPCARCNIESTDAVIAATRQRIGPWYVLQARHPSAPGIRLATLLGLIERKQVVPTSVVRGPTTHQLWKFAVQVRGVSRHFGRCHQCAGSIEATTRECPHCGAGQTPPDDPDQLLESPPQRRAGSDIVLPDTPGVVRAHDGHNGAAARVAGGAAAGNGASGNGASGNGAAAGESSGALAARDPYRAPDEILTPHELAAVFKLNFQAPAQTKRAGFRWGRAMAAVLLLALTAGVVVFALDDALRARVMDWMQTVGRSQTEIPQFDRAPSSGDGAARQDAPVFRLGQPGETPGQRPGPDGAATGAPVKPPTDVAVVRPPQDVASPPATRPAGQGAGAGQGSEARPSDVAVRLMPPSGTGGGSAGTSVKPAPAADLSDPAVRRELAENAMRLWRSAIEAQGAGDLTKALAMLRDIQRLPEEVRPAGFQRRFEQVQQALVEASGQ